jgi:hypothetical protein
MCLCCVEAWVCDCVSPESVCMASGALCREPACVRRVG